MSEKLDYSRSLLAEFCELCDGNGIEYKIAWGPEEFGSGVLLSTEGCRRLLDVTSRTPRQGRAIESWDNSAAYPDATLRYVATDTLCYNVLDYQDYKYHGIFVEINVIRKKGGSLRDKLSGGVERGLLLQSHSFRTPAPRKTDARSLQILRAEALRAGGPDKLRRKTFAQILKGPAIRPGSKEAEAFKVKTYPADYAGSCIIDTKVDSLIYFKEQADVLEELADPKSARIAKTQLDKMRRDNAGNFKEAREVWETLCQIDETIKEEQEGV